MFPTISAKVLSFRERSFFASRPTHGGNQTSTPRCSPPSIVDDRSDAALLELNGALATLREVFPDVRPEVFREMLTTFSDESRLYVVTEALLQHRNKHVRGRLVLSTPNAEGGDATSPNGGSIINKEVFRSDSYKAAVKGALEQEFRALSQSTIRAVLAENNHSYLDSRRTLVHISTKSWRCSIVNLFLRRDVGSDSPLIDLSDAERGPTVKETSSVEFNEELHAFFVSPFLQEGAQQRFKSDRQLAEEVNDAEAEEASATYDCECCCMPNSFENIAVCSRSGHYLCSQCIRSTVKEAIFGQGWARSIDVGRTALRCIAPASHGECDGCINPQAVQRALDGDTDTAGLWDKVEHKLARQACDATGETMATCPFCPYAEIHLEPAVSWAQVLLPLARSTMPYSFILAMGCLSLMTCPRDIPAIVWAVFHAFSVALVLLWIESPSCSWLSFTYPREEGALWMNQGRKFVCRNEKCGRASCLDCSAAWRDVHTCHSASRQSLRTFVEAAITEAVKRTCPRCGVSFVKSSGCNKLVCVCGYAMCYTCRARLEGESYSHFCPHFRPDGGACGECARCDLYAAEDEEAVARAARAAAEARWWADEAGGRGLGPGTRGAWAAQGVLGDVDAATKWRGAGSGPGLGWLFG